MKGPFFIKLVPEEEGENRRNFQKISVFLYFLFTSLYVRVVFR